MELGNFLGKLKSQEKNEPQKFLALILTDEVVQSSVWHVQAGQTEIAAIGTPVEWDGDTGTTSELVTAVDATISSAVEGLSDEPNGVILGIPHSWTDKQGILGVKREFIKKISQELELQPLGFVVITDSILSYLKLQEGTPTTSILIQVSRDELTLVLVRLGRIEAIETLGRSDDVVEDVVEGIARFKVADNLPSRIILFNGMHGLDDIIQNLLSVDWPTQFNFLHIPKIEALPKDVAIRALSVAGGGEVAKSLGFPIADTRVVPDQESEVTEKPESEKDMEVDSDEEEGATEADQDTVNEGPAFLSAAEIGFGTELDPITEDVIEESNVQPVEKVESVRTEARPAKAAFVMPKVALPKFKLPKLSLNLSGIKKHWWITGASVLALGLVIFWFAWVLPSAELTVQVMPKSLDQDVELTLSTKDASIDFGSGIVPAQIETVSQSGEKTIETTGKKIVGDPAEGSVTIYNRTSASKTFAKGTTLAAGSLKFTLDSDVLVASKSAGSDYVDVPGKASVDITASAIGTESNIAAGTEFTIQSFGKDSYVAKNDAALTGGSSEEVQVVSKDDQKQLVTALSEEITTTLQETAASAAGPGTGVYLVPSSSEIASETYSAKVGETAKSLTGNLALEATLLRYKTDDVTTLVNSAIDQAVPAGYVRANLPSTVDLSASSVEEDGSTVKGSAKVKVALLPVVDTTALKTMLKGKKANLIESTLANSIPGYASTVVEIKPKWLPPRFKSLPRNAKNITVTIEPQTL